MVVSALESKRSVLEHAIDYQMRLKEILERNAAAPPEEEEVSKLGPFLTISRQVESGGGEISRIVGRRLGWSVLDKNLVQEVAERFEVSPKLVELMDETEPDWFRDSLFSLLEPHFSDQSSYVATLGKVMLLAAHDGRVVIVGRGAHLLLPRKFGLRVRLIAPTEFRVGRLAAREGLSSDVAERRLAELDATRNDFVHRHFEQEIDDPRHYDLVLDVASFGAEGTADLIGSALRLRGLDGSE